MIQIFFVLCFIYLNLLSIYNLIIITFPRYLNLQGYANIVDFLGYIIAVYQRFFNSENSLLLFLELKAFLGFKMLVNLLR
jgi:hypothetical protein